MNRLSINYYFVLAGAFSFFSPIIYAQEQIGQVVWARGPIEAVTPGEAARVLKRRSPIYEKDTLVTGPTGSGQVVFTDNSLMALRENSSLQVTHYHFEKNAGGDKETFAANLAKGGFRTITGAVSSENPDGYSTNTPVATIGVRGTQYSIYYMPGKGGMAAKLERGSIIVSNAHGKVILKKCTQKELKDPVKPCKDELYARVASANEAPKIVPQQPEEFKDDVKIILASFSNEDGPSSGGPPGTVKNFSINMPCN